MLFYNAVVSVYINLWGAYQLQTSYFWIDLAVAGKVCTVADYWLVELVPLPSKRYPLHHKGTYAWLILNVTTYYLHYNNNLMLFFTHWRVHCFRIHIMNCCFWQDTTWDKISQLSCKSILNWSSIGQRYRQPKQIHR